MIPQRIADVGPLGVDLAAFAGADRADIERALRRGELRRVGDRVYAAAQAPEQPPGQAPRPKGRAGKRARNGRERDPLDRYYTPASLAAILVGALDVLLEGAAPARIVEPSVGSGAWIPPLRKMWPDATILGVDIDPEAAGLRLCDQGITADLLALPVADVREAGGVDLVVGNPPFGVALAHVGHLLQLVKPGGLAALLLPATIGHLAGWRSLPLPERELPIQGRPAFDSPALSGRPGNGKTEYSLWVWRGGANPAHTIRERCAVWRSPRPKQTPRPSGDVRRKRGAR